MTDQTAGPTRPALFCAHANADGDATRCSCTSLGPGPHSREAIVAYEAAAAEGRQVRR
jgi:hypothetical protein